MWIIGVIDIGYIFKGTGLAAHRQELTGQVELQDAVDGLPETAQALTGISLGELMASVAETIQAKFVGLVWVRAEISQFRPIKGDHYAIELVEHDPDGKMVARVQAFMWRGSASKIIAKFRLATAGDLNAGIKVMLSVKTEFSATHGIRLVIQDIDPAYTLGDIQAKLKQIRETLARDGVFNRNRQLRAPSEFCKVAVVSPSGAAGLGDFKGDADILERNGLCAFEYAASKFQGIDAAAEIKSCLLRLLESNASNENGHYDAICVIRGGGSVTDLYWLNDLELARAIATSPIPVFTGIGHERDNTILDEVANQRFDTPSKVIAHIRDVICGNATTAEAFFQEFLLHTEKQVSRADKACGILLGQIQVQAAHQLNTMESKVEQFAAGLQPSVKLLLSAAENKLEHGMRWIEAKSLSILSDAENLVEKEWEKVLFQADRRVMDAERETGFYFRRLFELGQQKIDDAANRVEALAREVLGVGPQATLRRGFAIVRDADGKPVVTAAQAVQNKSLNIEFRDGAIDVKTVEN